MRSVLGRMLNAFRAFCGGFVIYIAVSGLAAFVLLLGIGGHFTDKPTCLPILTGLGIIETNCPEPLIKTFWKVTVGIPRFLMAFPTMEVAGIKMAIKGNYAILGGWYDLLTSHFLKYSILLFLLI